MRYVLSALIDFSEEGIVRGVEFARAAIRVTRRFGYEEVSEILADPNDSMGESRNRSGSCSSICIGSAETAFETV
ncbi:MAG: hypothetical protein CM1200mP2_34640 [Planctomycetaceae bacterium]|nr:MAG: hypothetical protein CM1200mP2_34640 [Planctomycetaceae bacterium]